MLEIKIDYSESVGSLIVGPLSSELKGWVADMEKQGKIKDAIDEIRTQRAFHVKKIEELDAAIRVLESVASSSNGQPHQTMVVHNMEFANDGIAEAAVTMIRRAQRPLHVKEIAGGLQAGGYKFKSDNPLNSVGPVLFLADKNHKHGIVSKGKNTYSIREIEDRKN